MENVFFIPTDKPSKIIIIDSNTDIMLMSEVDVIAKYGINQNLYITYDGDDLKDNDYIITKDGRLVQISYLLSSDLIGASKVVLTTDRDLVKEGIQEISNSYIEWFITYPNRKIRVDRSYIYNKLQKTYCDVNYVILILQE